MFLKKAFDGLLSSFGLKIMRSRTFSVMENQLSELQKHVNIMSMNNSELKNHVNIMSMNNDENKALNDRLTSIMQNSLHVISILSEKSDNIANQNDYMKNILMNDVQNKVNLLVNTSDKISHTVNTSRVQTLESIIFSKWNILDRLEEIQGYERIKVCPICGFDIPEDAKEYITFCIFNGGRLVRHQCPECDVIVGPSKMFHMWDDNLSREYKTHYMVYNEADCMHLEERAFYDLNPNKEGIYLNYGAGAWSQSTQNLHDAGYNVYSYEPYAPDTSNPYLITDKNQLSEMKFDGIFSHDLLEHLKSPIDELTFMKSILVQDGIMNHATACYEYSHEYTRFHLFFFLGKSKEILAEKTGLKFEKYVKDVAGDYYSGIFINK